MIRRYKIVLNQLSKANSRPIINSNLTKSSGYLSHDNSAIYSGLVNANNVFDYLSNPNNARVTTSFIKYLKDNIKKEEIQFLYSQANKMYPILNNYYQQKIKLNKEPSKFLLHETFFDTNTIDYKDTSFDYKNVKIRNSNKKSLRKLVQFKSKDLPKESLDTISPNIESAVFNGLDLDDGLGLDDKLSERLNLVSELAESRSSGERFELEESSKDFFENYYINIKINKTEASVLTTDYSQYLADCKKGGVVLKNCFVYLNKKVDPFESWGDNTFKYINKNISRQGGSWDVTPTKPYK